MSLTLDDVADRCIDLAVTEDRVRALWAEADSPDEVRRPYSRLELHMATDEPDFPALVADVETLLARRLLVENSGVSDAERLAKQFDMRLGEKGDSEANLALTLIVEQTSLLAKRPRAYAVTLVDKTGHLTHVMDFSRRSTTGGIRPGSA